jgi:ribosome assembly protein YihI (activator of Der GTPase)
MSNLTGKELELAIAEQMGREQTPMEKMVDQMENHLIETDLTLQALIDVADAGRKEMEAGVYDHGDRFVVIEEHLGQYRERHSRFIKQLYREKKKAA